MTTSTTTRTTTSTTSSTTTTTSTSTSTTSSTTTTTLPACTPQPSSISYSFNGTPIAQGNWIWFSSVLHVDGLHSTQTANIHVTGQMITFNVGTTPYTVSVPDATVTFCPSCTPATTTFSGGMWVTSVRSSLGGEKFLSGLAFPVPTNFPGNIHPVTWSGNFSSDTPGLTVKWKWAAAVYSNFSTDYNSLGVKPVDDPKASIYMNKDKAGTPENFKQFVTKGATGGGGANFTGNYSAEKAVKCPG